MGIEEPDLEVPGMPLLDDVASSLSRISLVPWRFCLLSLPHHPPALLLLVRISRAGGPPYLNTSICSSPPLPKKRVMAPRYSCPATPPTRRRRAATGTNTSWRVSLRERKKSGEEGVAGMEAARVEEEIGGGGDRLPFFPHSR
jgi:hypothetical protein